MYFGVIMGLYGISFWLPTLIKATGVESPLDVGLLSAIPYAVATVAMILVSRSGDQRRERRWHFAIPAVLGAIYLILSAIFVHNTVFAIAALTLACAGIVTASFLELPNCSSWRFCCCWRHRFDRLAGQFGRLCESLHPRLCQGPYPEHRCRNLCPRGQCVYQRDFGHDHLACEAGQSLTLKV